MRVLPNENFPGDAVAALRVLGHDCLWVRTESPGLEDDAVIAWAERESLVVLTFDKDFGELAWRAALPATCGIVLFRLPMPAPGMVGAVLAKRLGERDDWAGHFSVVEPARVRMRRIGRAIESS